MSGNPPTEMSKSVREIFTAALACSDQAERSRLLVEGCGRDSALRKQVESLLEEATRVGDFLEQPAVRSNRISRPPVSARRVQTGESPGDHVGPYQLVELVGEGGGGSVYRARQNEPVQRTVALKILKLGMDTMSVIKRFESERQALAVMDHPNIAKVLDAGASGDGRPFFVMDFVRGEPITDYCDAHALPVNERLAIFIDVCRAVEHAHQKGIIHRDLKPSNILVTERDGEPIPKVIDFGVAKATEPLAEDPHVTLVETVIGTPAYMSPEQAERGRVDVDTRSDVYSLGVLLYELLTSYTPVDAEKMRAAGIDELRQILRAADTCPPSLRVRGSRVEDRPKISFDRATSLEKLASRIRGDLDGIVMKCLELDRNRRYGSASELSSDLERFLQGLPVIARAPRTSDRMWKFVRRHRTMVSGAALLLLTLVAGTVISTSQAMRAMAAERVIREAHREQTELRKAADRDRQEANENAAVARLHEYVGDINVSHHALLDGHIAKALTLLERQTQTPTESSANSGNSAEDLRGFEWRYLADLCQGDPHRPLPALDSPIEALAFSREGDFLAVGTRKELVVWDLSADQPAVTVPGGVTTLAFFPDGERLVAGARQGVWVYDLDSGEAILELGERAEALALSPDGLLLATADRRGVTIWDTVNWNRWRQLQGVTGPLAFSPDGEALVADSREGMVVWPIHHEQPRVTLEDSQTPWRRRLPGGQRIAFSSDGAHIVVPHAERSNGGAFYLGVWDATTGKALGTLPESPLDQPHSGRISSVGYSMGTTLLATSSWDHSVTLWDPVARRSLRTLHGHRGEVWAVAVSPDGQRVASGSKNGEIKIWPVEETSLERSINGRWEPLGFSNDSRYLSAVDQSGTFAIFNLRDRQNTYDRLKLESSDERFPRYVLSIGGDLTTLAEGLADGQVRVRQLDKETETVFRASRRRVDSVMLSPAADTLVTVGWRDDLAWWDLGHTAEPIMRISASQAVFSADGSTLATFSRDGHGIIWDTRTRTERGRISQGGQSFGSRIALSPDGKIIAVTYGFDDFENAVGLWNATTGERLGTLTGHKQAIWSLAFAPDGRTLATSSSDGTLRLWNVASRRELMAIDEAGTNLTDLRFSPDGYYLVGGSPPFALPDSSQLRIIHAPPIGLDPAEGLEVR